MIPFPNTVWKAWEGYSIGSYTVFYYNLYPEYLAAIVRLGW